MTDHPEFDRLIARQRTLEELGMSLGNTRFRDRLRSAMQKGTASQAGAAKKMLVDTLEPLTAAITDMLEQAGQKPGAKHVAVKWVTLITPEVAAYMTVKVVLDAIGKRLSLRKASLLVSELILDELKFRRFEKEAPALFEYKLKSFHTSHYKHMARSMSASMRFADLDVSDLSISDNHALLLGSKLIGLLVESTGMVTLEQTVVGQKSARSKPHRELFVVPTVETTAWLDARNEALEDLFPVYRPMVVPPAPWAPGIRGGYLFALKGKHPLVRGVSKAHATTIAGTEMPAVYSAINRIQETAYTINKSVYQLVRDIELTGNALAGIPAVRPYDLPRKPEDIATNDEAKKSWKKKTHAVHAANQERRVHLKELMNVMATAKGVLEEEAIYFPCNMDFRGRVYPVVNYLNPQGNDLAKGLLTFAEGKPLGPDGARWLAHHGANCLDETPDGQKVSKMTIGERIQWIHDNTDMLVRVAEDPFADTWWAYKPYKPGQDPEARDEALQFFAFCVEWKGYMEQGENYVCSLPCAMDGSCNGLQHFGAMLKDDVGGAEVNLIPSERPRDIYNRIAEVVTERVVEMAAGGNELAAIWLRSGLLSRKLFKTPTMTFGYGSKKFGFSEQIKDYVKERKSWSEGDKALQEVFKTADGHQALPYAARLLSQLIWEALGSTVIAAFGGMAWMQQMARCVAAEGNCVSWTVPATGFPVRQEYVKSERSQIRTIIAGKVYKPSFWTDTSVANPYKQANAISPNVVHSLDAAALQLTVTQASDEGVEAFAMVHDSYATLPADCGILARCTRQSFVRLYQQHDVIATLAEQFAAQVAEEKRVDLPKVPSKGNLDVSLVLLAEYFFA